MRRGLLPRGVAACVVSAVLVVAPVSSAWAVDGSWWYDAYGVAEVNAQGADGHGVSIAVIDVGINTQVPMLQGADITVHEPSFCLGQDGQESPAQTTDLFAASHGTNVAAHIVGNGQGYDGHPSIRGIAPKARVIFYDIQGYYLTNEDGSLNPGIMCPNPDAGGPDPLARAVVQAVDDGADIISLSREAMVFDEDGTAQAAAYALHEGVIFVQALTNSADGYGMSINGAVRVQAIGPDLQPATDGADNTDRLDERTVVAAGGQMLLQGNETTKSWESTEIAAGSSFAAPLVAGMLADVWSVYPHATASQLIQSLIRNTGSEDHELEYDEIYGYGTASVGHMLRAGDPAQYPDENPLIVPAEEDRWGLALPTSEQIAAGLRPQWAPSVDGSTPGSASTPTPSPHETAGSGGSAASDTPRGGASEDSGAVEWVLPVALGVAGMVVVAGVVTLVVLVARRRPGPVAVVATPGHGCPQPGPARGQPVGPGQSYPGPGGYPPGELSCPPSPHPPQAGPPPHGWPPPHKGSQQGENR